MYGNVGLTTARGSGTNGYVQHNLGFVRDNRGRVSQFVRGAQSTRAQHSALGDAAATLRKANQEIVLHEQKRKIEADLMELKMRLEDEQKLTEDEIEDRIDRERKSKFAQLEAEYAKMASAADAQRTAAQKATDSFDDLEQQAKKERLEYREKLIDGKGDSHDRRLAQQRKNELLGRSLGIDTAAVVEGEAFDRDLQERKKQERIREFEEKKMLREKEQRKREKEEKQRLVAEKKRKRQKSSSSDNKPKRRRRSYSTSSSSSSSSSDSDSGSESDYSSYSSSSGSESDGSYTSDSSTDSRRKQRKSRKPLPETRKRSRSRSRSRSISPDERRPVVSVDDQEKKLVLKQFQQVPPPPQPAREREFRRSRSRSISPSPDYRDNRRQEPVRDRTPPRTRVAEASYRRSPSPPPRRSYQTDRSEPLTQRQATSQPVTHYHQQQREYVTPIRREERDERRGQTLPFGIPRPSVRSLVVVDQPASVPQRNLDDNKKDRNYRS